MYLRPEYAGFKEAKSVAVLAMASLAMSGVSTAAPALSVNNYHPSSTEHITQHAVLASAMVGSTVTLEQLEPHIHKPPKHITPGEVAAKMVTPLEYREWLKVHFCEVPKTWHSNGATYAGGLGISRVNYSAYGGNRFDPNEATATPKEQMVVGNNMLKINKVYTVPDQNVCSKKGW